MISVTKRGNLSNTLRNTFQISKFFKGGDSIFFKKLSSHAKIEVGATLKT